MIRLRETCQQYVTRRLSEGWRIAGSWRHSVFLSPPEGNFIRVVDLRNDTETLRPSAPGDLTDLNIGGSAPAATNWESVDEAVADEDVTYVYSTPKTTRDDLYNLPASSGVGTINFIKLYFRLKATYSGLGYIPHIKSNSTITEGTGGTSPTSWNTYSRQWNTNPADSQPWEWADIDALQIGIRLSGGLYENRMTQIYVEVDYVGITPKTSSDSGSGVDASVALLATLVKQDSGSGIDAFTGNRDFILPDSGVGQEALGDRDLGAAEVGLGDDIVTLNALLSKLDSAVGIDKIIKFATVWEAFGSDSGTGADIVKALKGILQRGDSGSGIDAKLSRDLLKTDAGIGADTLKSLIADILKTESGEGVDTGIKTILEQYFKRADAGVGVDIAILHRVGIAMKLLTYLLPYSDLKVYTKPYCNLVTYTSEVKR